MGWKEGRRPAGGVRGIGVLEALGGSSESGAEGRKESGVFFFFEMKESGVAPTGYSTTCIPSRRQLHRPTARRKHI